MKFTEEELRQAVAEGLSHRKMAAKFGCAVMTVRRGLEKYGLKTGISDASRNCKLCGKELTGHQQYFCSWNCKNLFYYRTNKEVRQSKCHRASQRCLDRKRQLVEAKGGKCERCGYHKNYGVLNFHHKDITTKSFNLNGRALSNKPWDEVLAEADKCMLLCSNCHLELHYPHLDYLTLSQNNFIITT